MSDDWDVDSYKTEFENEEHWELRRNFMLAHKDKFSEDELVCLAQVFTNIEFLGCRYPEKTMIRVAELAKGVVEGFREKRKDSLKRTFVAASDAASAKVKGQLPKGEEPKEHEQKKIKREASLPEEEKSTNDRKFSVGNDQKNETSKRFKYGGVKTFKIKQNEQVEVQTVLESESEKAVDREVRGESDSLVTGGELGEFVLVLPDEEEHPINIIQMNASLNKCTLRWEIEHGLKICKLFMNGLCLGTGSGRSAKISKEEAAKAAIAKLRESYYGIRMKSQSLDTIAVGPSELEMKSESTSTSLGEDNVGRKLMKLMGWQGGGLGRKEQGREQPVSTTLHVRRDGLGLKSSFCVKEFRKYAMEYIQSWAKSDSEGKLVFSTDFTSEERKIMHDIAKFLALKSRSYGKDDNRHLVISRRPDFKKILQQLLKLGGSSDKYELLIPTKC